MCMLNFSSLLLFSEKPEDLAEFYKKILISDPVWDGGGYYGFMIGKSMLIIGPHDKVAGKNKNPERMMFNLEIDDVQKEFRRIKKLGAKVIQEPYNPDESSEMTIATFADPDDNYFQLTTPVVIELSSSQLN